MERGDLRRRGFREDLHCTGAPGQKYGIGAGAAAGLAPTMAMARRDARRARMGDWGFILFLFLSKRRWRMVGMSGMRLRKGIWARKERGMKLLVVVQSVANSSSGGEYDPCRKDGIALER